jgi:hypothetical protein
MDWLTLTFGKHKGKTLPQIVLEDPDWFFIAYEEGEFTKNIELLSEANEMVKKATSIKVPSAGGERRVAEYSIDPITRKFSVIEVVPESQPFNSESIWIFRKKVIDLTVPRNLLFIDTSGGERIALQVKDLLFGKDTELTRETCEGFFNEEANFDICGGKKDSF